MSDAGHGPFDRDVSRNGQLGRLTPALLEREMSGARPLASHPGLASYASRANSLVRRAASSVAPNEDVQCQTLDMAHNRGVAEWRISGTYLEFCNCDPGCGCNFRGLPNSPEGNCQAVISHVIEEGSRDGLDLAGAKVSWALWWPGAIHDKGGKGPRVHRRHRRAVRGARADLARGGGLRPLRDLRQGRSVPSPPLVV